MSKPIDPVQKDLESCPFCGEKPKLKEHILWKHNYVVHCTNDFCGVEPCTKLYPKKEQAIEAWNRRVTNER